MRDTEVAPWEDSESRTEGGEEEDCWEEVCESDGEREGWATQREAKVSRA
jgi:hypothetical protein